MNSYSTEQVATLLGITADGVRNYKKRNPDRFIEGQHYYKDGNSLFYTEDGLNLIRLLRGEPHYGSTELQSEPQSGSTEPQSEPQSGSELLNQLLAHFRPLLKPLARAISGPLKEEFEREIVAALFDDMEPLSEEQSHTILKRHGLAPGVDLRTLATGRTAGYLSGNDD